MNPEDVGRMKAELDYLKASNLRMWKKIESIQKWQWKAVGFLTALTTLTEGVLFWIELKGGK